MAFELRLTFSGLTALVPNKDVADPTPAEEVGEWLVVMPALKNGRQLKKDQSEFSIAPHQPVLVVNAQAVRPAEDDEREQEKKPRLRFGDLRNGSSGDRLLFELDRELLEIRSGAAGLQVRSSHPGDFPKNPDELHDIKWVPSIHDYVEGGVPFDRTLLGEGQRPTDTLAGVVRLDRGRLEVSGVHMNPDETDPDKKVVALFEFRGPDAPEKPEPRATQALATSFRLRVPVAGNEATLVLTNSLGEEKYLVVRPDGDSTNDEGEPLVEVKVYNLELEKILGLGEGATDSAAPGAELADTDFAIFYELSSRWDDLQAADLVLPYFTKPGGGGSGRPCEPPKYAGMDD